MGQVDLSEMKRQIEAMGELLERGRNDDAELAATERRKLEEELAKKDAELAKRDAEQRKLEEMLAKKDVKLAKNQEELAQSRDDLAAALTRQ